MHNSGSYACPCITSDMHVTEGTNGHFQLPSFFGAQCERCLCPFVYLDHESGTMFAGRAVSVTLDPPWEPLSDQCGKETC